MKSKGLGVDHHYFSLYPLPFKLYPFLLSTTYHPTLACRREVLDVQRTWRRPVQQFTHLDQEIG